MTTKVFSPMKRFRDATNKVKSLTSGFFSYKQLQRRREKYNDYTGSRSLPIDVDTVLLFIEQVSEPNAPQRSFAFNFDYIEKAERDHTVRVSIKPDNVKPRSRDFMSWSQRERDKEERLALNERIEYSAAFSMDEFKPLLRNFIAQLRSFKNKPNADQVFSIIRTVFGIHDGGASAEIDNSIAQLQEIVSPLDSKISKAEKSVIGTEKALSEADKKATLSLYRTSVYRRKIALLEELKQVEKEIEAKREELEGRENVGSLKKSFKERKSHLKKAKQERDAAISEFISKQDSFLASRLKASVGIK